MSLLQAVILGLVQGFTEFLPVSSSGHLALIQSLFDDFEQPGLLYDTLLHLATLFAVTVFFRRRIFRIILAFFGYFFLKYRRYYFEERNFLRGIIVATIPTGLLGFYFKDIVENLFDKPVIVGYGLIVTSLMLYLADKQSGKVSRITYKQSLIVGIAQGLAVFPGISRSGTTIFAGLVSGMSRQTAAEFSFLISIPAILGATLLQFKHLGSVSFSDLQIYLAGMSVAFISGLVAIGIMLRLVVNSKMRYFAVYCLVVGIFAVLWF